jgi:hypothetical protein
VLRAKILWGFVSLSALLFEEYDFEKSPSSLNEDIEDSASKRYAVDKLISDAPACGVTAVITLCCNR